MQRLSHDLKHSQQQHARLAQDRDRERAALQVSAVRAPPAAVRLSMVDWHSESVCSDSRHTQGSVVLRQLPCAVDPPSLQLSSPVEGVVKSSSLQSMHSVPVMWPGHALCCSLICPFTGAFGVCACAWKAACATCDRLSEAAGVAHEPDFRLPCARVLCCLGTEPMMSFLPTSSLPKNSIVSLISTTFCLSMLPIQSAMTHFQHRP